MLGKFIRNYGKGKFASGVQALQDAIVAWDPEGSTEAAIAEIEENFDEVNREFSKAKQDWQREQAEADEIVALHTKRVQAAELLQQQSESDPSNEQISAGLVQLLDVLEGMQDDIDREKQEAEDAKEVMDELEATVKMYGEKLKTARSDMQRAQKTMQKAQAQEEAC
jgi:chromosome segregation ATPase